MSVKVVKLLDSLQNTVITGGLVPKGTYAEGTDYAVGDSVDYEGSSYVMFNNAAAGTVPTNTTYWQVLSEIGSQGNQGEVGNQGDVGDTGAQGSIGNQGNQGSQGNQGNQGSQGNQGNQGEIGNQGSTGEDSTVAGPQGSQGTQGNQGTQGSQGDTGEDSTVAGPQGAQGNQGSQGNQGNQGSDAEMIGPQGYQGNQGEDGYVGSDGAQGNQGFQGDDGVDGAQGNQGAVGNQGSQGNQGSAGSQGNQGAAGSQGNQGATGPSAFTLAPSSDTVSGITMTMTAHANVVLGDVCYINADGEAQIIDADAIATSKAIVMAAATISADATGSFLVHGIAHCGTLNPGWTVGNLVYGTITGTSTNTMSQTAPTGVDDAVVILGVATAADTILFNPGFQNIIERT